MSANEPDARSKHSPICRRAFLRGAARGTLLGAAAAFLEFTGCYTDGAGYFDGWIGPYNNYSDNVGYYNDTYGNYNDTLYMDYVNGGYADYANYDDYPNFSE